jgi:glycosyltransferase involved in cell wall biosynthesis
LRADTPLTRLLARACDRVAQRDEPAPPQRLRVVFLDHVATPSGAELALSQLIAALPNVDASVILGQDGPLRGALEAAGAAVEILPLDERARDVRRAQLGLHGATIRAAWLTARYTWRLARRLRELDPDVVHANSLKSGYYGALAARLAGKPVIWHLHDRLAGDYLPAVAVRLTRTAVRWLPDLVVCNSRETRRAAALPAAPAYPVIASACALAAQPGRRNGAVRTIGTVGRLTPWKGQDVFLRAFAAVAAGVPGLEARIIGAAMFGEDDYAGRLRDLAQDLGIGDRVTFTGFVADVPRELSGLDILVHASVLPEPFGNVVIEGLAAGVPVVASDAGGPAEMITHEDNGLLVPPGDVAALAGALRRLIADAGLRARLSAAGPARAADFQPAAIGARVEQVYRDLLLASRSRPGPGRGRPRRRALAQYVRDELVHPARELLARESLAAAADRLGVPGARAQIADRLRHPRG